MLSDVSTSEPSKDSGMHELIQQYMSFAQVCRRCALTNIRGQITRYQTRHCDPAQQLASANPVATHLSATSTTSAVLGLLAIIQMGVTMTQLGVVARSLKCYNPAGLPVMTSIMSWVTISQLSVGRSMFVTMLAT